MHRRILTASLSALLTAGAAGLALTAPAPAPAVAAAAADAFAVDNVHSSVLFKIKHMNVANFYGVFTKVSGSFAIDAADPSKSVVDVQVEAASIDSRNKGRDEHINGPDFFSSKEFPTISFKSTSFKKTGEGTYEVAGNLTFRGVTKPVTVALTDTGTGPGRGGATVAGIEARFTFKRTDFGNSYMAGKGLSDEVEIIAALEGARK